METSATVENVSEDENQATQHQDTHKTFEDCKYTLLGLKLIHLVSNRITYIGSSELFQKDSLYTIVFVF